ncbi:MAG: crotonase/enoyl-CoA hydratase family protein [Betaproteobacteria bacterium]
MADVRFLPQTDFQQVETRFDVEYGVYWAFMNPRPRPCFSIQLLEELRGYIDTIVDNDCHIAHRGKNYKINYGVLASKLPGVFNLGGDLMLFRTAIASQNRDQLIEYGEKCIDDLYPWHRNCDLSMTTFSLVQGDALGGGFEAALSATVVVAEESARMGFPEILFNLFPGMGAFSFLSRKIGRRAAEEMITSGAIYGARQLYDMGVVDVLAPDGTGEASIYSYIRRHSKAANGRRGFERVRTEISPITRNELMQVVEIWADSALRVQDRDLRMMERLVRAQQRTAEEASLQVVPNVVPMRIAGIGD